MTIELPEAVFLVRMYKNPNGGYWQGVIRTRGREKVFSLRTKNRCEATKRWDAFRRSIIKGYDDFLEQFD